MARSFLARRYRSDLMGVALLAVAVVIGGSTIVKSYHLTMLIYSGIYAIAALGMFVLFGIAGQISIGQAAFFGVGAYASALAATHAGIPPVLAVAGSTAMAAAFGWLVSRPLLRLTTNYLAMATLAFGVICFILFAQLRSLTGGIDPGIVATPGFSVAGFDLSSARAMFFVVGAALCGTILLVLNLVHSRVGRALRALKGSEVATAGLGIDVVRYKVAAFTLAAGLAGLAGALFAYFQSAFNASVFSVGLSIELLLMVIVGSVSSPWGALFGALFVTILPTFLEDFEQYKLLIYGVILTVVMIYMPDGFGSTVVQLGRRLTRRTATP
ncbi:branched-chain amino acid ABC transporter permease [Chelatococcus reniformis]|uniref:Branched-chain amino acid ABC transporter permease n=2 Tax=Chelatococcus reniformis TaxID=1494448 RepID=A0A916XKE7_9HYPH|nr:branched-chain amino acid ABC transporter permease [Chelatococcus reniformis]